MYRLVPIIGAAWGLVTLAIQLRLIALAATDTADDDAVFRSLVSGILLAPFWPVLILAPRGRRFYREVLR